MSTASGELKKPALLLTGASGGLARIFASQLSSEFRIVGVDPRPQPEGARFEGEFYRVEYGHRKMSEIFRQHSFAALLHLGRVRVGALTSMEYRFKHNVVGTQNLLSLARRNEVKSLIVLSTYHVYGAMQHNHNYITEEEPLRAAQNFPELADAVELDHAATTALWKHREHRTVVLRPVNIVGPRIRNTISELLRSGVVPKLMGYDPLLQFIHEEDMARAILLCLRSDRSGIFNVAGEGVIPFSHATRIAGKRSLPIPSLLAAPVLGALNSLAPTIPRHLLDYFKYPTTVSDRAFRRDFDFTPKYTTIEALKSLG